MSLGRFPHLLVFALVMTSATAKAIPRCDVMERAQSWVDAGVPYSQTHWYANEYGSYRQDCSGYVSMAWALPSSYTTSTIPQIANRLGSFNDLDVGDAVNNFMQHVVLFKEWIQPGVSFRVYAEARTGTNAQIQNWTVAYAVRNGYAPYRYHHIEGSGVDCACKAACGKLGCGCVNGECSGGFCPGSGCTQAQTDTCGAYGCGCVDGGCAGGFCEGSGCTAKEINDCAAFGSGCVDHQCNGGTAPGPGCTAKEMNDCGSFGCGCADHQCSGGYSCKAKGNGCTYREMADCDTAGGVCTDHVCSVPVESTTSVADEEILFDADGGKTDNGAAPSPPRGTADGIDGGAVSGGCAAARNSGGWPNLGWFLLAMAGIAARRRLSSGPQHGR